MSTTPWRTRAWHSAGLYEPLNLVAWIAAWVGLGLLAVGFWLPRTMTVPEPAPWQVTGQWTYRAPVPRSVAEDETLPLGAPLYQPVTPEVAFTFAARLVAPAPPEASTGQAIMHLRLADDYGWSRTWPVATTRVSGPEWEVTGTVDLDGIERAIRQREAVYPPARGYTLTVTVAWAWEARVNGEPWQYAATSSLHFRREGEGFFVLQAGRSAPGSETGDVFAPVWKGVQERSVTRPRRLSIGPLQATVDQVRSWGWGLALSGGLLLLLSNAALGWARTRWPEVYFRAWLGGHGVVLPPGPWMDVWRVQAVEASPEALLHLAHKWGEPVLLVPTEEAVHLWLRLPEAVYHHATAMPHAHDEAVATKTVANPTDAAASEPRGTAAPSAADLHTPRAEEDHGRAA